MYANDWLTTTEVLAVLTDEIIAQGGAVKETYHDGTRLFARAVLPREVEVRPHDRLQGGVALKDRAGEIWVRPYVFREVCRNGAIMAQSIHADHLVDLRSREPAEADYVLREAIRSCCAEEAFTAAVRQIRAAAFDDAEANVDMSALGAIPRLPPRLATVLLGEILDRFFEGDDQSRFGLMNAVTSLARDTHDPQLRWDLEELGGGVPIGHSPPPRRPGIAAELPGERTPRAARRRKPVTVG
jgi:hypothetical protein